MIQIASYLIYLLLAAFLVFMVGYWFYHFGAVYILELFPGKIDFAHWINKLLLVGYYLLNLGFVLNTFQSETELITILSAIRFIAEHLGNSVLVIALMHYFNLSWIYYLSTNHTFKSKYLQS